MTHREAAVACLPPQNEAPRHVLRAPGAIFLGRPQQRKDDDSQVSWLCGGVGHLADGKVGA